MGMWALWRVHDVYEEGTPLVEEGATLGARNRWALRFATPVEGSRALPDGEVIVLRDAAGAPAGCGGGLCTGVPIPSVIPMPLYPMAPMPQPATVDPLDPRKVLVAAGDFGIPSNEQKNPGYPFWIGGCKEGVVEGCAYAGHRPPSPPLDLQFDGGLPRHVITGPGDPLHGPAVEFVVTRLDLTKELLNVEAEQLAETGTAVELDAMAFHAIRCRDSILPDGTDQICDTANVNKSGKPWFGGFITNGMAPQPGAPMADPCVDNKGDPVLAGGIPDWGGPGFTAFGNPDDGQAFFQVKDGNGNPVPVTFGRDNTRMYKVANIMVDLVFNKVGWHYPQNRIITAWQDINATYTGARPAEPFVFRGNTLDCIEVDHTNLTPSQNELDDYQIRFPTDIIGQHTHMPKFDLPSADGAANGWNYEDGTMSPGEVIERIHAINHAGGLIVGVNPDGTLNRTLLPEGGVAPPQLAGLTPFPVNGARITIQRWMMDPVLDNAGRDRGIGNVFTHDHFGPSTFQQIGLYATVLAEPAGSKWVHNETGVQLGDFQTVGDGGRIDGGPVSWQAVILPPDYRDSYREFYFEYSDFQHAYERAWDGIVDANSFLNALSTSVRVDAVPMHPLLVQPGVCPPGVFLAPGPNPGDPPVQVAIPRPCPKAITSADEGTFVLNYRSEPVGLRVYDPNRVNPFDGFRGFQTAGTPGDLSFAFSSAPNVNRAIPALNQRMASCVRAYNPEVQDPTRLIIPGFDITNLGIGCDFANPTGFLGTPRQPSDCPPLGFVQQAVGDELLAGGSLNRNFLTPERACPQLTNDVLLRDPATPLMRAFAGDVVKVRTQVGAHEESHFFSIHGQKWLMNYSDPDSGWRNTQSGGISENFQFDLDLMPTMPGQGVSVDYYYASDTSNDGNWTGTWGIMRVYNQNRADLVHLPNNIFMPQRGAPAVINNPQEFIGVCPAAPRQGNQPPGPANLKVFNVSAVAAWQVLPRDQLIAAPNGTLIYNSRPTVVPNVTVAEAGVNVGFLGGQGPLHDQTALMYVLDSDLVNPANPAAGLRPGVKPEPLVLRANAGDCIRVNLTNRLPVARDQQRNLLPQFDQDGWTEYPPVVNRRFQVNAAGILELITFNANDTAPSSEVGFHTQLLTYDVQDSDGTNVGQNRVQTIQPGQTRTYTYYAGLLKFLPVGAAPPAGQAAQRVNIVGVPIEFGAVGILPSDKLEQVNKGMVGSIVVLPEGVTCVNDAGTKLQATCTNADGTTFRDFVAVTQSGVNVLYANRGGTAPAGFIDPLPAVNTQTARPAGAVAFRPVQNVKPEGGGAAADTEDSGTRAVAYKTEPEWFRLALFPPHLPLEQQIKLVLTPDVYSNTVKGVVDAVPACAGNPNQAACDPQTPIFTAAPGQAARLHFVEPGGGSRRAHGEKVHGHIWQREPHVGTYMDMNGDGKLEPITLGVGNNIHSQMIGLVEGYGAANFFDLIFDRGLGGIGAGGRFAEQLGCTANAPCDFWYGSEDPPSRFMGMWGIMRVPKAAQ